jgi:hypothetical protein
MGEIFHDKEQSGRPSVVIDILFKVLNKKVVKGGALQFQNIRVTFHTLSQLGYDITSFAQGCARNTKNGLGFNFFRAIPQR